MPRIIRVRYEGGVLKPLDNVGLRDEVVVLIEILGRASSDDHDVRVRRLQRYRGDLR